MRMWLAAAGLLMVGSVAPDANRLTDFEQTPRVVTDDEWCQEAGRDERYSTYCEVRELTSPAITKLAISDTPNGSISVTGSNRSDLRIRARVVTRADTDPEARALAGQVTVSVDGGRVRTDGPRTEQGTGWQVSYRADVPTAIDLDLETANGSIAVTDIRGTVGVQSSNGSLRMNGLSGNVTGRTSNGSVSVTLSGSSWTGEGLDVRTSNGSVVIEVPEDYNAQLSASTGNGSLRADIPVTVEGRRPRRVDATLGAGGATIRVTSSNGSVRIRRPRD